MNNDIAIKLSNVSKFYKLYKSPKDRLKEGLHPFGKKYHKEFYALKDINLEVKKGEVLGVVGKNGCGKSTLLKLISGILVPNQGKVEVNGKVSALLELGAGFNPQFTGLENIKFYGMVLGLTEEEIEEKLDEIVAFADIGEFIGQPVKTYSSGMKSRLGFAVAVHVEPDILILDEVLAVGDALFKRKCYAKMEEFFKGGRTIIYVSHSANSVKELCTSAILMDSGDILLSGPTTEITKVYQKYVYAPDDRKDIVLKGALAEVKKPEKNISSKIKKKSYFLEGDVDYFVPDLTPNSTTEYGNKAVNITDAKITTLEGKQVNMLGFGRKYIYSVKYVSREQKDYKKVTFGFSIKNSKGVRISAIDPARAYQQAVFYEKLSTGDEVVLSYEFECRLPAGVYFIDSGLSSFASGEQEVLNRVVDITSFQVVDLPNRIYGGLSPLICNVCFTSGEERWSFDIN